MLVGNVGNPVVRVDIVDAEEVEAVETQPDIADECLLLVILVVQGAEAHTDVGTFVGWSSVGHRVEATVWGSERQSVGVCQFERHLPTLRSREIICKEEVQRIALVAGHRYRLAIDLHLRVHHREGEPRVGAGYELSVEFQVESQGVAGALLAGIIDNLHIVYGVGHKL